MLIGLLGLVGGSLAEQMLATLGRAAQLPTHHSADWWGASRAVGQWLAQQPRLEFTRVATVTGQHDHRLLFAPIRSGLPQYKVGYSPAFLFRHAPTSGSPETLRALSVRYVVSNRDVPRPDMKELVRFEPLGIYELDGWNPRRWHVIAGEATVDELRFDERGMEFVVRTAEQGARIVLHVAPYVRWQAWLDGEELPLASVVPEDPHDPVFMSLPLRPGRLALRYVRRTLDWVGLLVSLLGLAAALLWGTVAWRRGRAGA